MAKRALMLVALAMVGSAANAGENPYGFDHIVAKDMRAAETRLEAQRAAEPNEPSVLINLAWVYRKTGREAEAQALYERVLAEPSVLLAMGNGRPASSHMLAMKGLGRSSEFAAISRRP